MYFLAGVITFLTLGLGYPWAYCLRKKWVASHTLIEGRRCRFTGSGGQLIGLWIKWSFLFFITFGIYGFWIGPNLERWATENMEFE